MFRLTRTAATLAATALLAGCGSDPTGAGTIVSAPPTATGGGPSAAPTTPPALTREQAADRYLDIVRPYNEALEQLERAVNGGEPLADLTSLADAAAEALAAEIDQLRATSWPAPVQPHVDELADLSGEALPHWRRAAGAQSREELVDAVRAASEFDGADAAGSIRELLDLDPYDEDDY